MLPVN